MTAGHRIGMALVALLSFGPLAAQSDDELTDSSSMDETALLLPTSASLAIWTDKPGYLRFHDLIRVYLALDPHGDRRGFSEWVYLENIETKQRRYLGGPQTRRWLRDEVVDYGGQRTPQPSGAPLVHRPAAQIWSGRDIEPGLWQFVAEVRSPDSTEIVKTAHAKFVVSARVPRIIGAGGHDTEITTDTTWTNDTIHAIRGQVFVNAGATLTIEPGTLVLARGSEAAIVVEQGGRIVADGRPDAPIVMTCDEPVGHRFAGCWSGLVILGRAPVTPGTGLAAGIIPATRPKYGGGDPLESSGILRYVRVEFAGAGSGEETQRGGLSLCGVGAGTVIDHVQVHASGGDGIQVTGGTANCMYCVSSGALDDELVWDEGWQGIAQHVYLQQHPGAGDCAIEGNDTGRGPGASPSSSPKLYNLTAVGSPTIDPLGNFHRGGIVLRGGSPTVRNAIVTGFASAAIVARRSSSSALQPGAPSIANAILHSNGNGQANGHMQVEAGLGIEYLDEEPALVNLRYAANPDPRPMLESPALKVGAGATPPSDGVLDTSAQWLGAFGNSNWLEEWTFLGPESMYRTAPDGTN